MSRPTSKDFEAQDGQNLRGSDSPTAQITEEIAREIHRLYHQEDKGCNWILWELDLDVGISTVEGVVREATWAHATQDLPTREDLGNAGNARESRETADECPAEGDPHA